MRESVNKLLLISNLFVISLFGVFIFASMINYLKGKINEENYAIACDRQNELIKESFDGFCESYDVIYLVRSKGLSLVGETGPDFPILYWNDFDVLGALKGDIDKFSLIRTKLFADYSSKSEFVDFWANTTSAIHRQDIYFLLFNKSSVEKVTDDGRTLCLDHDSFNLINVNTNYGEVFKEILKEAGYL